MGCDYIFTCVDCKIHYDLGYGSYTSWIHATSMEGFSADAEKIMGNKGFDVRELRKNQALRECIQLHESHKVHLWSHDYADVEDGKLIIASGPYYECLEDDVSGFEWVECGND